MTVQVATSELLLDSLIDNPNIKAAVLVDDRGYIIEQRGSARCIKAEEEDQTLITGKRPPLENIYIVQAEDDFLIVVFDERLNFERLKKSVDSTLGQFGMEVLPSAEPDKDD